jgi:hypothetical protein
MKKVLVVLLTLAAGCAAGTARAQPLAQNAALRYWMAFSYMQNPPADQDTAELLEMVASGKAAWDEARLGKILDANAEALAILQRGTTIPDCDWGLEYDLGSDTPVAYIAKARVLGRLNILQGIRALSRGQGDQAADAWTAGIRFAQHVASNGTLLSALVGGVLMQQALDLLPRIAQTRPPVFDFRRVVPISEQIRALPARGLDWDAAFEREGRLVEAERRKNPGARYETASPDAIDRAAEALRASRQRAADYFRYSPMTPPPGF